MSIIFSGLSEADIFSCLGLDGNACVPMTWCSPSDFAANATASANDSSRWVWLYRAPWSILPKTDQDDWQALLERWMIQQSAALKLRRPLGHRLVLINIDQVSPTLICAELGLPKPELSVDETFQLPPSAMASLFEQGAPHYWDMYETLEAAAWLPLGEPQFRSNRPEFSEASLFSLLNTLQHGLAGPGLRSEVEETSQLPQLVEAHGKLLQRLEEMTDENRKATHAAQVQHEALTKENDLLLIQLHHVQEELASYYLANKEMIMAMGQSQHTMQRARGVVTRLISHG